MQGVMLSIQPKWCELIANVKKTIEIRKTMPTIATPFKCYIYCTQGMPLWTSGIIGKMADKANGKVIGEFVCNKIDRIGKRGVNHNFDYCYLSLNKFGNDDIEIEITDVKKSCISKDELNIYGKKSHHLFAWHMSNLVIYDEPKELNEFRNVCKYRNDDNSCKYREIECDCVKFDFNPDGSVNFAACLNFMTRPPQSWCYVESEA